MLPRFRAGPPRPKGFPEGDAGNARQAFRKPRWREAGRSRLRRQTPDERKIPNRDDLVYRKNHEHRDIDNKEHQEELGPVTEERDAWESWFLTEVFPLLFHRFPIDVPGAGNESFAIAESRFPGKQLRGLSR